MDEQLFLIAKQEIQDMVGFCLKKTEVPAQNHSFCASCFCRFLVDELVFRRNKFNFALN